MIDTGFSVANRGIWGIQITTNDVWLMEPFKKKKSYRNVFIEGSFIGFTNNNLKFDESIDYGEDVDASVDVMINGGLETFRLTGYALHKPKNGKNPGGCHHLYENGDYFIHEQLLKIIKKYPGLLRFKNKRKDCTALAFRSRL